MYSINTIIQKNKRNKKNQYPIYVRLTVSRLHTYFNTGLKIEEQYWDKKKSKIKNTYTNSNAANHLISQKALDIEKECIRFQSSGIPFTAKMIKSSLTDNSGIDCFLEYSKNWIANRKSRGLITLSTELRYNAVIEKLNTYTKGRLNILEFDYQYLLKYETYLADKLGNNVNTVSSNLKVLRPIFSELVLDGKIEVTRNPFLRYKFRSADVKIKYLEVEQIKSIRNMILPQGSKIKESRDIFLFCLNTGFRIGDALGLKLKHVEESHYSFISQKTCNEIYLFKTKESDEIVNYYSTNKESEDYVFNFLKKVNKDDELIYLKACKSATALINKNLRIISERLELPFNISTHYARHSLAKNGLKNGLSMEELQSILHHKNIKTTQIYAKAVNPMKDAAMIKYSQTMQNV